MLRIWSRNSAGRPSSARATSRAKRACRRRDMLATLAVALRGLLYLAEGGPEPTERARSDPTHTRLGEPDLHPDLTQRQATPVREHDHTALHLRERSQRVRDALP